MDPCLCQDMSKMTPNHSVRLKVQDLMTTTYPHVPSPSRDQVLHKVHKNLKCYWIVLTLAGYMKCYWVNNASPSTLWVGTVFWLGPGFVPWEYLSIHHFYDAWIHTREGPYFSIIIYGLTGWWLSKRCPFTSFSHFSTCFLPGESWEPRGPSHLE